jgi:hypothetical protein
MIFKNYNRIGLIILLFNFSLNNLILRNLIKYNQI